MICSVEQSIVHCTVVQCINISVIGTNSLIRTVFVAAGTRLFGLVRVHCIYI